MPKQSATGQGDKRAKYAGAQANKQRRHKTQEHPSQADHPEAPPSKRRRTRRPTITLQQKTAPDGISRPSSADSPSQPHPPAHPFANGPVIKTSLRGRHSHKGTLELPTREHVISQTPDQRQDAGEEGEKRVLRSQAGISRSHSELALFFTDYEEVVFGPEKAPDDKTGATSTLPIRNRDGNSDLSSTNLHAKERSPAASNGPHPEYPMTVETLDMSQYDTEILDFDGDPLADEVYLKPHDRGERKEKRLRNVDKERAAHEKQQLEKLYAGLRGPDWLKTMGISGITDTEKKSYEAKRALYTDRVKGLLQKFEVWRDREKRQKRRKEKAAARLAEETDEDSEEADEDSEDDGVENEPEQENDNDQDSQLRRQQQLDESALQLYQEAVLAAQSPRKTKPSVSNVRRQYKKKQLAEAPFTSFYAKPHERAGALGKHRRGRHVTAFGLPVPDIPERVEFALPGDIRGP